MSDAQNADDRVRRAIDAVWRMESARLIAGLARIVRDVGTAEELASAALVTALEKWPVSGVPDNPGAWLMATAKNRAIDQLRWRSMRDRKHQQLAHEDDGKDGSVEDVVAARVDDDIGDDLLRLIFTACHPVLSTEARVALTLRLVGGLTTEEIARAFLVPVPTMAQRIVRAKTTLKDAGVGFEAPQASERAARLSSVLEVLYLIFNEGYAATAGDDWVRPALCEDALRLARVLAGLAKDEAEAHGLVALLEIQASRLPARVDAQGEPVLLLEQNRARWDRLLIGRGLAALARAEALSSTTSRGPYTLQAAIAACHARAATADETDWVKIAALYAALSQQVPSPVIELNRAVAVGRAFSADAGLAVADDVAADLDGYHLLHSVRGDLLSTLGRDAEAAAAFDRAAALTKNARERALLLRRAAESRARASVAES